MIKSHAIRKPLNESIFRKSKQNEGLSKEEIMERYKKEQEENLTNVINWYLRSEYCRKKPMTVYFDKNRRIVSPESKDAYQTGTLYAYNYQKLCNAISKVVKKLRPDALPGRSFLHFVCENAEENLLGENMITLKIAPSNRLVGRIRNLSENDIYCMQKESIRSEHYVHRLIMFYLEKKLEFTTDELKQSAKMILDNFSNIGSDIN